MDDNSTFIPSVFDDDAEDIAEKANTFECFDNGTLVVPFNVTNNVTLTEADQVREKAVRICYASAGVHVLDYLKKVRTLLLSENSPGKKSSPFKERRAKIFGSIIVVGIFL